MQLLTAPHTNVWCHTILNTSTSDSAVATATENLRAAISMHCFTEHITITALLSAMHGICLEDQVMQVYELELHNT